MTQFIREHGANLDNSVHSFYVQEKRAFISDLSYELKPFFPEFFEDNNNIADRKPLISVEIPKLDIQTADDSDDVVSLFLLYRSLVYQRSSIVGYPFWEVLPIWLLFTDLPNDKTDPVVTVDDDYEVITVKNLSNYVAIVTVHPQQYQPDAYVLVYYDNLEIEPIRIELDVFENNIEMFQFEIQARVAYLKVKGVPGHFKDCSVSSKLNYDKILLDPTIIHDEFVTDVKSIVHNWEPYDARQLLMSFTSNLLMQQQFEPIQETALSSKLLSRFSRKVILFESFLIHRFNYMCSAARVYIEDSFWKTVLPYISSEDALRSFVEAVEVSTDKPYHFSIDRHSAHRLIIDGKGSNKNSVIYQFSSQIQTLPIGRLRCKEKPWTVTFKGESAIDSGGPRRELFYEIANSIFEPTSNLFIPVPNGRRQHGSFKDTYIPYTTLGKASFNQYRAIGTFIGIIIRNGYPQSLPFAPLVWSFLADESISENDIFMVDEQLKMSCEQWRAAQDEPDFAERFGIRWQYESWDEAIYKIQTSEEGFVQGKQIEMYIHEVIQKRLKDIDPYLQQIRVGFYENIGFTSHPFMSGPLLSLLAQGSNIVTTSQLKAITVFYGFKAGDVGITNFWIAVEKMTNDQRSLLLKFVTTLARLPNSKMNNEFKITVVKANADDSRLPCAATCFNKLMLPSYSTPEIAYQKLTVAVEMCQTMENI
ncbi:hypothetical protein GPJ56_010130 [Histomonas meleagridis]|uniref:uncharacterized protein n=1 Tax=Histomonas meleagridis TaxID=135588 RepID=UPI00355A103C|nr:hypothetical protein GPJ56_010130 [Histomonas meleagridis]KAH0806787.1 hypothetical protein GO595_000430 [Histomonas meleagridis]